MGDRISRGREPFDTKALAKDYPKMTVCGKMAWDYMRAVDVLSDMKGVDPSRIGVIGHGMGGQNALLVSALDERIQACVASAAFTRFADRSDLAAIAETCLFTLVPETGKKTSDAFAFDWEHVLALGAPSPTLLAGAADISVFPGVKSCQQAARLTQNIYKLLGASQALETFEHDSRRCIDLETLEAADDWFARWL